MPDLGERCLGGLGLRYHRAPKSIAPVRYRKLVRSESPPPCRSASRQCRAMFGTMPNGLVARRVSDTSECGSIYLEPGITPNNAGPWAENSVHPVRAVSRMNPAERDCRVRSPKDIQKHGCAAVARTVSVIRERLTQITDEVGLHVHANLAHVRLGPACGDADLAYELIYHDRWLRSYNAPERPRRVDRQHGRRARWKAPRHGPRDAPKVPVPGTQRRMVDGRVGVATALKMTRH